MEHAADAGEILISAGNGRAPAAPNVSGEAKGSGLLLQREPPGEDDEAAATARDRSAA